MNRFTATGLVNEAAAGKTVLVATSFRTCSEAFDAAAAHSDAQRVVRTSGRQRVEFVNGGRIAFVDPAAGGGRGMTADVVAFRRGELPDGDALALIASTKGELIDL